MISFVVAMGKNRAIGKDNTLPWYLPADLKHFKEITTGHKIVMGRKTFESLPGVLPNRHHIVLTRDKNFKVSHEQVTVVYDIKSVMKMADTEEIFVIGGAEIFKEFLPQAGRIYLTILDQDFEADVYLPEIDMKQWVETERREGTLDEKNTIPHTFITLEKKI